MERKSKAVTLQDVARESGVSTATISRVLNGKLIVTEETHKRVIDTVERLGYQMTPSMRQVHSNLVITVLPNQHTPFLDLVLEGIRDALMPYGYVNLVHRVGPDFGYSDIETLHHLLRPTGFIFAVPLTDKRIEEFSKYCAVVQCSEHNKELDLPFVSIDDYAAARDAVNYLIRQGCTKIAMINGPTRYFYARERRRAYMETLRQAGLPCRDGFYLESQDYEYDKAYLSITQLLSRQDRPDAIFAASESLGIAAVNAARRCRLAVPRDLSVIGFDNTYLSAMCVPPLTTVYQPAYRIGNLSGEIYMDRLLNRKSIGWHIQLDGELLIRNSTTK